MNLVPKANFASRSLYHHDNLPVLRGMNSRTVHLIATDPPFNKGKDFHATPESLAVGASFQDRWSWDTDVHEEWVDSLSDNWPKTMNVIQGSRQSYGDDMGAFLCFMAVRLIEMRRVLSDTGSLYLHCDPTASHYLKELLDSIFGRKNFRNEIVWGYTGPGSPNQRQFSRKHDTIFWYSKSDEWCFNADAVRVHHHSKTQSNFKKGLRGSGFVADTYDLASGGKIPESWWVQRKGNGLAIAARQKKQYMGYPTQKPLALYERIVKASSNEGDMVLDPFAGCATTCVAAERLNRQWVGIDIWEKAHEVVIQRLEKEGLIGPAGETGGRLFHAGQIGYLTEPPERTDEP